MSLTSGASSRRSSFLQRDGTQILSVQQAVNDSFETERALARRLSASLDILGVTSEVARPEPPLDILASFNKPPLTSLSRRPSVASQLSTASLPMQPSPETTSTAPFPPFKSAIASAAVAAAIAAAAAAALPPSTSSSTAALSGHDLPPCGLRAGTDASSVSGAILLDSEESATGSRASSASRGSSAPPPSAPPSAPPTSAAAQRASPTSAGPLGTGHRAPRTHVPYAPPGEAGSSSPPRRVPAGTDRALYASCTLMSDTESDSSSSDADSSSGNRSSVSSPSNRDARHHRHPRRGDRGRHKRQHAAPTTQHGQGSGPTPPGRSPSHSPPADNATSARARRKAARARARRAPSWSSTASSPSPLRHHSADTQAVADWPWAAPWPAHAQTRAGYHDARSDPWSPPPPDAYGDAADANTLDVHWAMHASVAGLYGHPSHTLRVGAAPPGTAAAATAAPRDAMAIAAARLGSTRPLSARRSTPRSVSAAYAAKHDPAAWSAAGTTAASAAAVGVPGMAGTFAATTATTVLAHHPRHAVLDGAALGPAPAEAAASRLPPPPTAPFWFPQGVAVASGARSRHDVAVGARLLADLAPSGHDARLGVGGGPRPLADVATGTNAAHGGCAHGNVGLRGAPRAPPGDVIDSAPPAAPHGGHRRVRRGTSRPAAPRRGRAERTAEAMDAHAYDAPDGAPGLPIGEAAMARSLGGSRRFSASNNPVRRPNSPAQEEQLGRPVTPARPRSRAAGATPDQRHGQLSRSRSGDARRRAARFGGSPAGVAAMHARAHNASMTSPLAGVSPRICKRHTAMVAAMAAGGGATRRHVPRAGAHAVHGAHGVHAAYGDRGAHGVSDVSGGGGGGRPLDESHQVESPRRIGHAAAASPGYANQQRAPAVRGEPYTSHPVPVLLVPSEARRFAAFSDRTSAYALPPPTPSSAYSGDHGPPAPSNPQPHALSLAASHPITPYRSPQPAASHRPPRGDVGSSPHGRPARDGHGGHAASSRLVEYARPRSHASPPAHHPSHSHFAAEPASPPRGYHLGADPAILSGTASAEPTPHAAAAPHSGLLAVPMGSAAARLALHAAPWAPIPAPLTHPGDSPKVGSGRGLAPVADRWGARWP